MARSVSLNGSSFSIPQTGDSGWSLTGGVDDYLVALSTGVLQKAGGTFTLTADVNFGTSKGLILQYATTQSANAAATGVLRLANGDNVSWRNAANSADLALSVNNSNQLTFGGSVVSAGVVPANLGGTGVANNSANTQTFSGNFGVTWTLSGTTALTLPVAGTLSTLAGTETLQNKTILSNSAWADSTDSTKKVVWTLSGATTGQTLTLASAHTAARTWTFQDATDTLVGRATSDTLTNKTLSTGTLMTAGKITTAVAEVDSTDNTKQRNASLSGATTGTATTFTFVQTANRTLTFPDATDTIVGRATTDTLTNKTINGANNTLTVRAANDITGQLPIASGGTGQATANAALNALLPAQTSQGGKALVTDGNNTSWTTVASASAATPTALGLVTSYFPTIQSAVKSVSSAGYTVTTADGYQIILVSTGASDQTITLPAASANAGRFLTIKKTDSGTGHVIISRAGTDTLDGNTTRVLVNQYDTIKIHCDGSATWNVVKHPNTVLVYNKSGVGTTAQAAGTQKNIFGAASGNGITLQPGTWVLSATAQLVAVSGTATPAGNGACLIALSATQDTGSGSNGGDDNVQMQSFMTNAQIAVSVSLLTMAIVNTQVTVSTATPYYLNGYHGYNGTVPTWYGSIKAVCVG